MSGSLQRFRSRYGASGFVRLLLYPLTLLVTNPVRLAQSLWNCRVLLGGHWREYNRFTATSGINSLFYWNIAENFARYGPGGVSREIGLGEHRLSRWMFFTRPSLYAYRWFAPFVPLGGMLVWLVSHAIWSAVLPWWKVAAVMFAAAASTTFYENLFVRQNYNVLGWMFYPLGCYGLLQQKYVVAAVAWLGASFTSITATVFAGALCAAAALAAFSIWPLLSMVPAGLKLATHGIRPLFTGELAETVAGVAKAVGASKRAVRYRRQPRRILSMRFLYEGVLYVQYVIASLLIDDTLPWIVITGIAIWLMNNTVARIADFQSLQMVMLSVAAAQTMIAGSPWMLASFWLLASPLPLLAGLPSRERVLDVLPLYAPFRVRTFLDVMNDFLAPVPEGERILFAFDDPGSEYRRVFDGFRVPLELALYAASHRRIHLFPDWWAVFDLNYDGAASPWGRDPESVLAKMDEWKAGYAIVYTVGEQPLGPEWNNEFEVLTRLAWSDYEGELRGERLYTAEKPVWWLLRRSRR